VDFDTFSVDLIQDGGRARLALTGELDLAAVPTLEAAIPDLAAGEALVVDLRDLTFIDSSGIHVLMRLDTAARDDGWSLVFVRGQPAVQRVLDLCHVGDHVRTVDAPGDIPAHIPTRSGC
jgi:anti-sigma B factor antagonist